MLCDNETALRICKSFGQKKCGTHTNHYVTGDPVADQKHMEELASVSGRPVVFNVVQATDTKPHIHRRTLAWLDSCRRRGIRVYGQGLTTDAGYAFTLADWNLFDECPAWREATVGTKQERLVKLGDMNRRQSLRDQVPGFVTGPFENITVLTDPKSKENLKWKDHTIGLIAEKTGKHLVDAMLDIAVSEELETEFFSMPPNCKIEYLKEIVDDPYVLFGVSDGGAHTKFQQQGDIRLRRSIKLLRNIK